MLDTEVGLDGVGHSLVQMETNVEVIDVSEDTVSALSVELIRMLKSLWLLSNRSSTLLEFRLPPRLEDLPPIQPTTNPSDILKMMISAN